MKANTSKGASKSATKSTSKAVGTKSSASKTEGKTAGKTEGKPEVKPATAPATSKATSGKVTYGKPVAAPKPETVKPEKVKPVNHHRIPPQDDGSVRVVKVGRCHSMSGKSQLTYHVGASKDNEVLFRIHANSAAGFFSQEWVALLDVERALSGKDDAKSLTSFLLHNLFKGKSINTPGFLLAVLRAEGMVQPSTTVKRCFEHADRSDFAARMRALVNGSPDVITKGATPKSKDVPVKVEAGRAAVKKAAVSTQKKTPSVSRK